MKHTLIIGATRGIGRAVARTFLERGHAVSVIARRVPADGADEGPQRYWAADVVRARRRNEVLERIIRERGRLSHLVFLQRYRGEGDAWSGEIATTLTATKEVIERLSPAFDRSPDKSIVLVSSVASRLIAEEQSVGYHVAKAGLEQMARYFAVVLGAKGIRVNCVAPGVVLKDEARVFYMRQRKLLDLYGKIIPLGRMTTADEIAQVIAFLCSPKASAITGQTIVADAGLSLQWQESLVRRTALKNIAITRKSRGTR